VEEFYKKTRALRSANSKAGFVGADIETRNGFRCQQGNEVLSRKSVTGPEATQSAHFRAALI
jgi:hypothetical protein